MRASPMADVKITLTFTASLKALPKGFVLNEGASALDQFNMKKLTLRGKVGKRVRLVTVTLTEVK
jgi:hypothetical protein